MPHHELAIAEQAAREAGAIIRRFYDLPMEVRQESRPVSQGAFKLPPEGISFEDVERDLIMQAMEQTDYNITKSAKLLGLTFRTLQYRLEKFGIKKPGAAEAEEAPTE